MTEETGTITREIFHRELARAQTEQARLRGTLRLLLVLVSLLLVVCVTLAAGMWRLGEQVLDTTAEVNGLRDSLQGLFSDNLPVVEELQQALSEATTEADKINESMAKGGQFTAQVDEAMERIDDEMPKTFEKFFDRKGPELIAEAIESDEVTEAGREQTKVFMLQALDDPAIETKMKDKMAIALEDVLRGTTRSGSSASGGEKE
jgi:hypothetical protein